MPQRGADEKQIERHWRILNKEVNTKCLARCEGFAG